MIKIEIPSDNLALCEAFGAALVSYAKGTKVTARGQGVLPMQGPASDKQKAGINVPGSPVDESHFAQPHHGHTADETGAHSLTESEIKDAFKEGNMVVSQSDVQNHTSDITANETGANPDLSGGSLFADEDGATAKPDAGAKVDPKGVKKNPEFCATARDPFYKKGNKYADQWKKGSGVTWANYEAWYAAELLLVPNAAGPGPGTVTETPPAQGSGVDTKAAFTTSDPATPEIPVDIGGLVKFYSELMAAGRLKQTDIDMAWSQNALGIKDLMTPVSEHQIKINVQRMYTLLSAFAAQP